MTFNDSIWINATSRAVWDSVSSPEVWRLIYAKGAEWKRVSPDDGTVGTAYQMEFGRGTTKALIHCEIIGLVPCKMIAWKWTMDAEAPYVSGCTVVFTYELKDESFGTRVTERTEMTVSGDFRIQWAVKLGGWLTFHLRRLTGRTYLQRLKGVVERTIGS